MWFLLAKELTNFVSNNSTKYLKNYNKNIYIISVFWLGMYLFCVQWKSHYIKFNYLKIYKITIHYLLKYYDSMKFF